MSRLLMKCAVAIYFLVLRADMPIIMCTDFSDLIDARKAQAVGIKAFAMKPLTKRKITMTIIKVLEE